MFKKRGYKSLLFLVVLLNIFAIVAYPNEVYAIDDNLEIASMSSDTNLGKSILLTEYLFTNTPEVNETIDLNQEFDVPDAGSYKLLEYIQDDNGLDAFILEAENGEIILSIRGTEGKKFDGDMEVDAKLSLNQNEQYVTLQTLLEESKYVSDIDYVIGHSLGGSIALNTSMFLTSMGINLKGVYVFAPAPLVQDQYVTDENIHEVNKVLNLLVMNNEILYNIGNELAGNLLAINPYKIFSYTLISVDNDINNSFSNHYVSKFIPIVKGETTAKYQYIQVH